MYSTMLTWGGGIFMYSTLIKTDFKRAETKYMNMHTPINILEPALLTYMSISLIWRPNWIQTVTVAIDSKSSDNEPFKVFSKIAVLTKKFLLSPITLLVAF